MPLKSTFNKKKSLQSSSKTNPTRKTLQQAPVSVLAQRAYCNPALLSPQDVLQLQRTIGNQAVLQLLSPLRSAIQRYRKTTEKTQDGYFVPEMKAAIHCHIGNKIREPHLKIRGKRYDFGNPHSLPRMQLAYEALIGDPDHKRLKGYDDCVEYLKEQGCTEPDIIENVVANDYWRPMSAYEDPSTPQRQKELIERGLIQGQYPPK